MDRCFPQGSVLHTVAGYRAPLEGQVMLCESEREETASAELMAYLVITFVLSVTKVTAYLTRRLLGEDGLSSAHSWFYCACDALGGGGHLEHDVLHFWGSGSRENESTGSMSIL